MMNERKAALATAIYLVGAILCFGFAYNHDYEPEIAIFDGGKNGFRAGISAMFWPFYLSKMAFEGARK